MAIFVARSGTPQTEVSEVVPMQAGHSSRRYDKGDDYHRYPKASWESLERDPRAIRRLRRADSINNEIPSFRARARSDDYYNYPSLRSVYTERP